MTMKKVNAQPRIKEGYGCVFGLVVDRAQVMGPVEGG
jgi:hypothetical protein